MFTLGSDEQCPGGKEILQCSSNYKEATYCHVPECKRVKLPKGEDHPLITYVSEACEKDNAGWADFYASNADRYYSQYYFFFGYAHYWNCTFIVNSQCTIKAEICYAECKYLVLLHI